MRSVRGTRDGRSGSYRAAWVYLSLAVACVIVGLVINTAAGNPSKLPKSTVLILGGSVLVLWAIGAILLLFAISRFNRARRAIEQQRQQEQARKLNDQHVAQARRLLERLLAGEVPVLGQVWDVVLQPGERVLVEGTVSYARYYGVGPAATHTHVATSDYGTVSGPVLLDHTVDRAGRRGRVNEAGFAAAARWRERQQSRVVVTDRRMLCQVQTKGWLSFLHAEASAVRVEPKTRSVVIEYPQTAPLCLSGPLTAQIMVAVVWALYGADGLREHPALAEVRSLAPLPAEAAAAEEKDPDPEVLALLAESELMLAEHVARMLGMNEREAAERLERLRERGLVGRVRLHADAPISYLITEQGAVLVGGSTPPSAMVDLANYRQTVAVTGT